jgi:hypothetical protein
MRAVAITWPEVAERRCEPLISIPTGITSSGLISHAECMLAALSANSRLIPPCKRPNGCRVAFEIGIRRVNPFSSTDTISTPRGSSAVLGIRRWKSASDFKAGPGRGQKFGFEPLGVYRMGWMLFDPFQRIGRAFVGRKHRIENVSDHSLINDQRQPLDQGLAFKIKPRQVQRMSEG